MLAHVTVFLLQKLGIFYSILRCWWENWRLELLVDEEKKLFFCWNFFKTNGIYNLFDNLSDVSKVCIAELICTYIFHSPHKKTIYSIRCVLLCSTIPMVQVSKRKFLLLTCCMYVEQIFTTIYNFMIFFNFRWR